jgi:hypothetical protein
LRRFQEATKWKFNSAVSGMRVILPVEPGTPLADDHVVMLRMAHAEKCRHRNARSHVHAQDPPSTGPRKSLNSVAKRKRDKQPGTATSAEPPLERPCITTTSTAANS